MKVFDPSFDDGKEASLQRFFREARMLFSLNHPNIVRIFDAGYYRKKPFIRMEYFDGKDLNRFFRDHGQLKPNKAIVLARKILEGLKHAHGDVKVFHRDLKPNNIMVAPGERVKIVDFGLGVFVENDLVSRLTRTGENIVGGYYTAPELLQNPRLLDPRSDLFSVGAIWYTALVGRPPAGSDVPGDLDRAIPLEHRYRKALLRSLAGLEDRFSNVASMLEELTKIYPYDNSTQGP